MIAPCYHLVSDDVPAHVKALYPFRNAVEFERELDWLLARYEPVGLKEIHESFSIGKPLPEKSFFLSFDDGFREMAEVVAPICRRKGIPAAFFLTTDFLDNRKLGYRHKASVLLDHLGTRPGATALQLVQTAARQNGLTPPDDVRSFILGLRYGQSAVIDAAAGLAGLDFATYLRDQRPYLTCDQVRGMIAQGFAIGAHSLDHPRYSEIPEDEQVNQTRRSMEFLKSNFELPCRSFAFPFVSDGVGNGFYERVFDGNVIDLAFCIGARPQNPAWALVDRFGIERDSNAPIWILLRDMSRQQFRRRLRRLLKPILGKAA